MPKKTIPNKFNPNIRVNGLILAGGRARRMGGKDKGLVLLAGTSLIRHCVRALSPQVNQLFISANRNISHYQKFNFPVLEDFTDKYKGPLAGLQCALTISTELPILVVPCDAPLLPKQLANRLLRVYKKGNYAAIVPHDGMRLQPLFALFSPASLESLNEYLTTGQRKVESWVTSLPYEIVDFSDQSAHFLNINTTDDLRRAESLLKVIK